MMVNSSDFELIVDLEKNLTNLEEDLFFSSKIKNSFALVPKNCHFVEDCNFRY